jgi:competence protein ComEA
LYVLAGVLAGFILAGGLLFVMRSPAGAPIVLEPAPTQAPIAVHVIGAVPRPGLYEFQDGARVQDAIDAAGGLLAEADTDAINLAALLEDGQKLDVPYKTGQEPNNDDSSSSPDLPSADSDGSDTPSGDENSNTNADLVNINTATLDELDALPGIGPTTAQKIIDYRDENGSFLSIEDILNVSGIGPATFDEIKDLITV